MAATESIARDMREYCVGIGNRLAGSDGEREAAEYTAQRFGDLGLEGVEILPFSCKRWIPEGGEIITSTGRTFACSVITHSAATSRRGVEGDLVVFEPIQWEHGLDEAVLPTLDGRIGLFYGGYGESRTKMGAATFDASTTSTTPSLFVSPRRKTSSACSEHGNTPNPTSNVNPCRVNAVTIVRTWPPSCRLSQHSTENSSQKRDSKERSMMR